MNTPPRPEPIPLVDLAAAHRPCRDELRAAFERVLANSAFSDGDEVEAFESALAERLGVAHVVGVGSGTAALHLALRAAGIGPGEEVIVPTNSFVATAEAVVAAGACPVLVDVDPDTALIDLTAAAAAVTVRTAAVIPVHLYGQPVDAEAMAAFASRFGLLHLEDAAQAIGARWAGRPVGSLGDAAAFSFYPTKNLGALGQAGAVATDDARLAERVRLLRRHGERERYIHEEVGFNERLDGLQAAFLGVKLRRLDHDQARRDRAVHRYGEHLVDVAGVSLLRTAEQARHVHHLLVARVPNRDRVLRLLQRQGIGAGVHYPVPIHGQAISRQCHVTGPLIHSESLARSILSLPVYPGMTDAQVDRCVDALRFALGQVDMSEVVA